MVILDLMKP